MGSWSVIVDSMPQGTTYDFYRVWRKHKHMELTDEVILEQIHDFELELKRSAALKTDAPEVLIASYPHKENAENALKEVTNLGGTGRVEETTD
tara:strand:- start:199 stop:477 length:279 start_codon:yes stop_codon:yes gene_type:complete